MTIESFESFRPNEELPHEEIDSLYESLPENMKTGYYGGLPKGQLFSLKEEAGPNAIPYVIVSFADGRKMSLHLTYNSDLSIEQQAHNIQEAALSGKNIRSTDLMWRAFSK